MASPMAYKSKCSCEEHTRNELHPCLRQDKNSIQICVVASIQHQTSTQRHFAPLAMECDLVPSIRATVCSVRNAARARQGCLLSSGDTWLVLQLSGQTEFSVDHGQSPQNPQSPTFEEDLVQPTAASQQKKRRPTPRDIVDKEHLCTLIAVYNLHFKKYSLGKTNVTQLIPSLVWKNTYGTYKETYPHSMFKEELLKDRLRDTLKELKIGNRNAENAEQAALQSNSVMAALRCTDGHAKRNVLRKRASILESTSQGLQSNASDLRSIPEGLGESNYVPQDSVPSNSLGKDSTVPTTKKAKPDFEQKENQHFTKAQLPYKQSTAIERISTTYQHSTTKRDALVNIKIVQNEFKNTKNKIETLKTA